MRFGDLIRIQKNGPALPRAALWTIGVSDSSKCWGLWLEPSLGRHNAPRRPDDRAQHHLLLTPIAPNSWPYVFRMQIRLDHSLGALSAAARVFEAFNVNILSARATISGHQHATWNVIGEALNVKEEMYETHQEVQRLNKPSERKHASARITERLLRFLPYFVMQLQKHHKEGHPFLRERFLYERLISYEKSFYRNTSLWNDHTHLISKPVFFVPMTNLTYFWRHATNVNNPETFRYDDKQGVLLPDDRESFLSTLTKQGRAAPARALASFDTDEHYVRLDIFGRERASRSTQFVVTYKKHFSDSANIKRASSLGLLRSISRSIADLGMNVLHVRNAIENQTHLFESGWLRFIAEIGDRSPRGLDEQEAEVIRSLENLGNKNLDIRVSGVRRLLLEKMFLSMHVGARRSATIRKTVKERVERAGFELASAETLDRNVTEEVAALMNECAGVIQVLSPREETNSDGKTGDSDMTWLIGEFFGTFLLALPALRFADESEMTEDEWRYRLKIGPDRPLHMFHSGSDKVADVMTPKIDEFLARFQ